MGFIGNLAKGFVRSTVNQVGRDTGRVISGKLYTTRTRSKIDTNFPENSSREDLLAKGYKISTLRLPVAGYFWIGLFSLIPLVGSIIWLYKSIKNFFKTKTDCYTYTTRTIYARDRRYRTGARYEGSYQEKLYYTNKIKATKKERNIYIGKGFIALFLAFAFFYFHPARNSITNDVKTTIPTQNSETEITVINAVNGLNLRKESSNNAEILRKLSHNSIVEIIQLKDSSKTIDKTWILIQLETQEKGWVWGKYLSKKSLPYEDKKTITVNN